MSNSKSITIEEARKVLGKRGKRYTDAQLQGLIAMFQNLAESWLNDYETKTLGKPIKDLLTDQRGDKVL